MPRTKSAQKSLRASLRRRKHNLKRKAAVDQIEGALRKAVAAGERQKARELLSSLYRTYDKAAKRQVISRPRAARKRRQAARLVNRIT